MTTKICIARGDGIGPEIMQATLDILKAAGAELEYEELTLGEQVYLSGNSSGIDDSAWEVLRNNPILLKAPITTPQGGGYKSLNVTLRKTLGLFSNIRRSLSYDPILPCRFKNMDVIIFRENEEDLYAGIEHRQTHEVFQCLKLTTTEGSKKIITAAFEYAKTHGRKKITCMSKDNIMKLTDGMFHRTFDEIKKDYPEIETDHMIIDIGAAKLANNPEAFDVVVCQNLYGDILSDITAEISGSVGIAGSANLGEQYAMFEAIHGSAPDIAGKNIANPTGLTLAAVEMLIYLGQHSVANKIHHAILKTLEDGKLTGDLARHVDGVSAINTSEFASEVISRLGQKATVLKHVSDDPGQPTRKKLSAPDYKEKKVLVGVDVFIDDKNKDPNVLAAKLEALDSPLKIKMITNRGVMVWPRYNPATYCTDHWRCRFQADGSVSHDQIAGLLSVMAGENIDFIKTEGLYEFDGNAGYSLGQGQ